MCKFIFSDFIQILGSNIIMLCGEKGESATALGVGTEGGFNTFFLRSGIFGVVPAETSSWH